MRPTPKQAASIRSAARGASSRMTRPISCRHPGRCAAPSRDPACTTAEGPDMKPHPVALPEFINQLRAVLARHPQVNFAMLFGSLARGTARPDSDLRSGCGRRQPPARRRDHRLDQRSGAGHRLTGGPDRSGHCRRAAARANPQPRCACAGRQHPAWRAAQPSLDRCGRLCALQQRILDEWGRRWIGR